MCTEDSAPKPIHVEIDQKLGTISPTISLLTLTGAKGGRSGLFFTKIEIAIKFL
jgi:hypothetical protein